MKVGIAITIALLAALAVCMPFAIGQQSNYEKALVLEETQLKLKEAIALYQKVVDSSKDKALAAQAQLRIGFCFAKLGAADAEKAFRKVIEKYPDQAEAVRAANEQLLIIARKPETQNRGDQIVLQEAKAPGGHPSPDGKAFAYVDYSKAGNLAIVELATGQKKMLTDLGSCKKCLIMDGPVWSANGSQLAFSLNDAQENWGLCTVDLNGAGFRTVYANPGKRIRQISGWTPDQKTIYVIVENTDWTHAIGKISLSDGKLTEIRPMGRNLRESLLLSPDGRFLVYGGGESIRLMSPDGRDLYSIKDPNFVELFGWTPDSRNLLFLSTRDGGAAIWIQPLKDASPDGKPKIISRRTGSQRPLGFSRDGTFYFEEYHGGRDVYIAQVDLDSGRTLKAPERVETVSEGQTSTPFWSSDGEHLGYLYRTIQGSNPFAYDVLRIHTPKTGNKRNLLLDLSPTIFAQLPRWSPRGDCIFLNGVKAGKSGLFRIDIASGVSEMVYEGKEVIAWSADGTIVYFDRAEWPLKMSERKTELVRKDLRTGDETQVLATQKGQRAGGVSLSLDGNWLGFSLRDLSAQPPASAYHVVPAQGGPVRQLTPTAEKDWHLWAFFYWAPSQEGLLFGRYSTKDGTRCEELRYMPSFDAKESIKLDLEVGNGEISFHPDGKTVAFSKSVPGEMKIWKLENYMPAKKR